MQVMSLVTRFLGYEPCDAVFEVMSSSRSSSFWVMSLAMQVLEVMSSSLASSFSVMSFATRFFRL